MPHANVSVSFSCGHIKFFFGHLNHIQYLYSVFCIGQHSSTSTVMFKLQHYKSKAKDMVVQYIRDKAQNELPLHVAVCLHN